MAATHGGVLVIGTQWTIRLDDATPWDPALPPYPDDDSRLRRNLALVAARTYARAHRIEGEMPYRARPCSKLAAQASALLGRHATMLRAALCRGDLAAACGHGRAMLGLGPGLTPSGDDFLVGFFAVLHIARGPGGHCAGICADIVSDAEGHTNAISVAALRAAARGRVRASIVALVQALLDGSANEVSRALTPVLAIGSTSGADIVAGIVSGFEVQLHAGGRTKRAPARMRRPRIGATAAMVGASDRMIDTTGGPGWKAHSSFLAA